LFAGVYSAVVGELAPADAQHVVWEHRSGAFGDGSHPTTRLCGRAIDLLCRQTPGARVLDVGTGTAVLARLARAQGANHVVGTDIDDEAIDVARRNVQLDDARAPIAILRAAPNACGLFDIVMANILEGVLMMLANELVAAVAPRGALVLSGFTAAQAPTLRHHFTSLGLAFEQQAQQDGWVVVVMRRAPTT
jgi:ribosomal protein L11 methyltransferase